MFSLNSLFDDDSYQPFLRIFSEGESDTHIENNYNDEIMTKRSQEKNKESHINLGPTKYTSAKNNFSFFQIKKYGVNEETYHHKVSKRKTKKKIFIIIKTDKGEKKKEIITENGKKKVEHLRNRQSLRKLIIRDMIVRNLIQKIIPDWINYEEKDKNNYLRKINPSLLKESNYLDKNKNKTIKEIFELKNVNEDIVENSDKEKLIKLKFTLTEIFLAFNQKKIREELLFIKIPELIGMDEEERKIYVDNFYNRLKEKEEYCDEKGGSAAYQKKLKDVLNKLETDLEKFYPYLKFIHKSN